MLSLSVLSDRLAVCRLPIDAVLPARVLASRFFAITRTQEELSIVCDERLSPEDAQVVGPWRAIKVEGPLDFALTGILAGLSGALSAAGISLFALSTYDTDYILVREADLPASLQALSAAGYQLMPKT
jgi:uncharacterized protein